MSRVTVRLVFTIRASMEGQPSRPWTAATGTDSAIGWGFVPGTLTRDAEEAEALVIMHEPAHPGIDVEAQPVAVLHLTGEVARDEFLCVADDPSYASLLQSPSLIPPIGSARPWADALTRLAPRSVTCADRWGSREEAESLLDEANRTYLRLTGCLE